MNETKQKHSDTEAPWKHKMESESWSQRATLHIQGSVQLFKDGGLHKISADGVAVAIPISNKSVLTDSPVETNKDSSGLKWDQPAAFDWITLLLAGDCCSHCTREVVALASAGRNF